MGKISTFFGIGLILIILFILLIMPGLIARLIFRRTNKSKLMNLSALPLTFYLFYRADVIGMLRAFSEGYGREDLSIIKWIVIFQFLFTFIVSKYFARLGIEAGDKLRNIITSRKLGSGLHIEHLSHEE